MIIFTIGLLLFFYGVCARKRYSAYIGMLFVLLVMGFQSGVGGDFQTYKDSFERGLAKASMTVKDTEFAFLFLNQIFSFTSFGVMVFITSLGECLILAKVISTYVPQRYQNWSWLFFFFTTGCMLIQMKALRQGYAMELCLLSFFLLDRKRLFASVVALVLAWGMHNSAVLFIPFYVLFIFVRMRQNKKDKMIAAREKLRKEIVRKERALPVNAAGGNKRKSRGHRKMLNEQTMKSFRFALLVSGSCLFLYLFKKIIIDGYLLPYMRLMNMQYEGYVNELEVTGIALWIIAFYTIVAFCLALYYKNEKNLTYKYIAFLSIVSIYASIFVFGLGNLMRIVHYFTLFTIISYPRTAAFLHKRFGQPYALTFLALCLLFAFKFSSEWIFSTSNDMFGTYRFVFM